MIWLFVVFLSLILKCVISLSLVLNSYQVHDMDSTRHNMVVYGMTIHENVST